MSELLKQLELLTGQASDLEDSFDKYVNVKAFETGEIGISALNELLLSAGFDRVDEGFFALLFKGVPVEYKDGMRIIGVGDLKKKVNKIRIYGALKYGNFKFAFKRWAMMSYEELYDELVEYRPVRDTYYSERTKSIEDIEGICTEDTPLLGYVSGETAVEVKGEKFRKRIERAKRLGEKNLVKYLTFNHMDVYVATSMRLYRDYINMGRFIKEVFNSPDIIALKIRYFDPTQVYSDERICKSLIESLMLKRAKCTVYCAQEAETLGKDSELAITLAQGKPVIVYVPSVDNEKEFKKELIEISKKENKEDPIIPLRRYLVMNFQDTILKEPDLLKTDNIDSIANVLTNKYKEFYEKKAKLLHAIHPLAIQMDLNSGVANGVLLVRNANQCVKVLHRILTRQLKFYFEEKEPWNETLAKGDYQKTYILREEITKSPFRVVIGDTLLTNSFWNFYLEQ